MTHWSYEETDDQVYADQRKFYKVEKWTRDDMQIERPVSDRGRAGHGEFDARAGGDAPVHFDIAACNVESG